jgi:hypothetical protein
MSEDQSRPPATSGLRASDEDREHLVDELNEHAVAGRLDTDELEERLQSAYAARTTAELDALRRDLPLGAFIVCTIIWAADGASGQFWPVWVLLVVVLTFARSGWALFGPAPDLDAVEARLDAQRRGREHHRQKALTDRDQRRADRHERRRGR